MLTLSVLRAYIYAQVKIQVLVESESSILEELSDKFSSILVQGKYF